MTIDAELCLVAVAANLPYHDLFLMGGNPVAWMLIAVACGAQFLLYFRCMLYIRMAFITGYLVIRHMVLMHEFEVVIFFHTFPDIMT